MGKSLFLNRGFLPLRVAHRFSSPKLTGPVARRPGDCNLKTGPDYGSNSVANNVFAVPTTSLGAANFGPLTASNPGVFAQVKTSTSILTRFL